MLTRDKNAEWQATQGKTQSGAYSCRWEVELVFELEPNLNTQATVWFQSETVVAGGQKHSESKIMRFNGIKYYCLPYVRSTWLTCARNNGSLISAGGRHVVMKPNSVISHALDVAPATVAWEGESCGSLPRQSTLLGGIWQKSAQTRYDANHNKSRPCSLSEVT